VHLVRAAKIDGDAVALSYDAAGRPTAIECGDVRLQYAYDAGHARVVVPGIGEARLLAEKKDEADEDPPPAQDDAVGRAVLSCEGRLRRLVAPLLLEVDLRRGAITFAEDSSCGCWVSKYFGWRPSRIEAALHAKLE
jgi:YD repeat-containing protein